MSEGRHHDTEQAAEEEVDLEELLEQFREPEEPRKKRGNPVWLILAAIVSGLGFWMAMKATTGTLSFVRQTPAKMKPTKVRDRASLPGPVEDVAADYAERCRKGLSSLEVRWILEDFRNAGLGEGPGSLLNAARAAAEKALDTPEWQAPDKEATANLDNLADQLAGRQRAWYRAALVDGFRMDDEQKKQVRQSLARSHQEDWESFQKLRTSDSQTHYALLRSSLYNVLVDPRRWLEDDRYAPWNLCTLTENQLSITRRDQVVKQQLDAVTAGESAEEIASWFELGSADSSLDFPLAYASAVFPLDSSQEDQESGGWEFLHTAQLKILLLLEPGLADELMSELDRKGE